MAWTDILKKLIGDGTLDEEDAERQYERLRKDKKLPKDDMGGDVDKASFMANAVMNHPYEEGGEMEGTASSPAKANLAKARIKIRQDVGPEAEGRYARSAEYEIDRDSAERAIEKRRAIASTRDLKPGATSEDALKAIEKAGGLEKYWESMSMADEEEREAFEKKLRRLMDGLDDESETGEGLLEGPTIRSMRKPRLQ